MSNPDKHEENAESEMDDGLCLDDSQASFIVSKSEKDQLELVERENAGKWRAIGYFSLVVFTAIQVFNPIMVRVAHKESAKNGVSFLGSTTVFATEVFKIILCCVILPFKHRSLKEAVLMIYRSFTVNRMESLKVCLPALLFVLQNNLYFFALKRLDVTLFSISLSTTYQLRILSTAVLMMLLLNRRFSFLQWVALIISLFGAVIVKMGDIHQGSKHGHEGSAILGVSDQVTGLCATFIMCLTTAFGCVYLEAVLKKSDDDIFLQNIRLGLVSLPVSAVTIFTDYETIQEHGFFAGWNFYVYLIVLVRAFAGIVVSAVICYTDNIKKGFCQALGLGGTAVIAILLHDSEFSLFLMFGVISVVFSVILYALASNKKKTSVQEPNESYDWEKNPFEEKLLSVKATEA